jgi:hypothetical protein
VARTTIRTDKSSWTEDLRDLKWALQQLGEREGEEHDELDCPFELMDDVADLPDVLVSARPRRGLI